MKLTSKMAVHCDTEEKAMKFLKECHEQGVKWGGGNNIFDSEMQINYIYWIYKDGTVYYLNDGKLSCGYIHYASKDKVISFDDLLKTTEKKKCKIYDKSGYVNGDIEKVIINEPYVVVYLDTGEKGLSKCHPDDEFNEELGYKIAYKRAIIKKLKNKIKKAEGILRFLIS